LKKSRRPYFGSVATGWCALLFQEMVNNGDVFSRATRRMFLPPDPLIAPQSITRDDFS